LVRACCAARHARGPSAAFNTYDKGGGLAIDQVASQPFEINGRAKVPVKQVIARRMNWKYPAGLRLIAEYWLQSSDLTMTSIAEAENVGSIMSAFADWDEVFEITVVPAVTAEEGLQFAKQLMA
jgi:hypothetical protein